MSSRNPTVSSSTTFSKKIKKPLPPVIPPETAMLISEVPDFLRRLNIMRVPTKPAEQALPCSKTETEEIIAAMKETLMASPAPTPVILPKKRKRPIYDFKQLAEKIAKHDHNEILDPKIEENIDNTEETVPIPVVIKKKGKKLMNEIEVGLIKQNRLRRKRENPSKVPERVVPPKKAKLEIQENKSKTAVELISVKKSTKSRIQSKKVTKVPEKIIDENFASKIQTRNRKKNFIEESLSNEKLIKEERPINNNDLSSSFVDLESSQEISSSDVPLKKTVKVNPFKPKARNRRKPGVFFGSRKRKRNLKTENKVQPSKVDNVPLPEIMLKSEFSDSNAVVLEPTDEQVLQNCDETLEDNSKTKDTVPQESLEHVQNEPIIAITVKEENVVTAPISADTTESLEPEEAAEPRWPIQSDAFYDLPSTISLGSILSSVNQAS